MYISFYVQVLRSNTSHFGQPLRENYSTETDSKKCKIFHMYKLQLEGTQEMKVI